MYIAAKWRRRGKRKDRMKLSLALKLVEKLVCAPQLIRFVKVSFPVMCLMPYYPETGRSRPLIAS